MCEIMERIRSEAKAEGRAEGRAEGQACINRLHAMLIDAGRFDDLERVLKMLSVSCASHLVENLSQIYEA